MRRVSARARLSDTRIGGFRRNSQCGWSIGGVQCSSFTTRLSAAVKESETLFRSVRLDSFDPLCRGRRNISSMFPSMDWHFPDDTFSTRYLFPILLSLLKKHGATPSTGARLFDLGFGNGSISGKLF